MKKLEKTLLNSPRPNSPGDYAGSVGAPSRIEPGVSSSDAPAAEKPVTMMGPIYETVIERKEMVVLDDQTILDERLCSLNDAPGYQAFKVIRTEVINGIRNNQWRSVAVVSPTAGDGKSLVSLNLGFSIAHDPRYAVLLVDFDLRNPSLHTKLHLSRKEGVEAYFRYEGNYDLADLIVCVHHPKFALLPCLEKTTSSSEILMSEYCGRLVTELTHRYDDRIVLFDLPPICSGDDVMSFLPRVDAVVLVVGEGVTTKSELEDAYRILGGKPILSVVLNQPKARRLFSR